MAKGRNKTALGPDNLYAQGGGTCVYCARGCKCGKQVMSEGTCLFCGHGLADEAAFVPNRPLITDDELAILMGMKPASQVVRIPIIRLKPDLMRNTVRMAA